MSNFIREEQSFLAMDKEQVFDVYLHMCCKFDVMLGYLKLMERNADTYIPQVNDKSGRNFIKLFYANLSDIAKKIQIDKDNLPKEFNLITKNVNMVENKKADVGITDTSLKETVKNKKIINFSDYRTKADLVNLKERQKQGGL